jgi:hypothetical protein
VGCFQHDPVALTAAATGSHGRSEADECDGLPLPGATRKPRPIVGRGFVVPWQSLGAMAAAMGLGCQTTLFVLRLRDPGVILKNDEHPAHTHTADGTRSRAW